MEGVPWSRKISSEIDMMLRGSYGHFHQEYEGHSFQELTILTPKAKSAGSPNKTAASPDSTSSKSATSSVESSNGELKKDSSMSSLGSGSEKEVENEKTAASGKE